jgi:hypothetical protein
LHTIGGLIGASVGSVPVRGWEERIDDDLDPGERAWVQRHATGTPNLRDQDPQGIVRGEDRAGVSDQRRPGEEPPAAFEDAYPRYYRRLRPLGNPAGVTAVGIYWAILGLLGVLVIIYNLITDSSGLGVGLFALLIFGPAVQLAASVLAAIVVAVIGGGGTGLWQIGKITLWTVVGTIAGILVMFVTCNVLR